MKKYIILLIVLLLGVGGVCFFLSADSDEAQVKRVFKTLCRMATKRAGDNPAAAGLMISKTDKIFAGEFTVKIGKGMFDGIYNPTKMTSELARYRAVFQEVEVDTQDMEIAFPAQDQAEADYDRRGILRAPPRFRAVLRSVALLRYRTGGAAPPHPRAQRRRHARHVPRPLDSHGGALFRRI
jgi:hypothetical protein